MNSMFLLPFLVMPLAAEDITLQRITMDDGKVLVGQFDAASATISLVDEKTMRVLVKMKVDPAKITKKEDVVITKPDVDPLDRRGINGKWINNYETALKLAAETRRPLLVLFTGSDWCSWCIKLEREIISTDKFKDWAKKHVVLLCLDFPNKVKLFKDIEKQNEMLQAKWGNSGYPSLLFVNDKGVKYDWKFGYNADGIDAWLEYVEASRKKLMP